MRKYGNGGRNMLKKRGIRTSLRKKIAAIGITVALTVTILLHLLMLIMDFQESLPEVHVYPSQVLHQLSRKMN